MTNLAGSSTFYAGLAAAFVAMVVLLVVLLPRRASSAMELGSALRPYTNASRRRSPAALIGLLRVAIMAFIEAIPRPKRSEKAVEKKLEMAGWPLRPAEFAAVRVGAVAVAALLGYTIAPGWVLAPVFGICAWFVPPLLLSQRVDKRSQAFRSQLPDTLQLIAGSLEAGYGFQQALDTVAQESPAPTSVEFSRVLTQVRLGMPISEALDSLAERIGGEEFQWVVLAVNIQRESGGQLSSILLTIADTMREREQLARQIQVLSAEGRLSAVILTILPIALAVYMAVVNPTYFGTMLLTNTGRVMVLAAIGLLVGGGFWMRRIVRIEV